MALLDKLQIGLKSRYLPFFIPVIASLAYIGVVVLVMPDELGKSSSEGETAGEGSDAAAIGSATGPGAGPASKVTRRRSTRAGMPPASMPNGMPGNIGDPGAGMPMQPPPQPIPASPDGAD